MLTVEPKSHRVLETFVDWKRPTIWGVVQDKIKGETFPTFPRSLFCPGERTSDVVHRAVGGVEPRAPAAGVKKTEFLSSLRPAVANQDYAALMNAKDSGSFFWPAFLVSVEVKFPWNQSVITMQTI